MPRECHADFLVPAVAQCEDEGVTLTYKKQVFEFELEVIRAKIYLRKVEYR
jgi:hypothetical protein